MTDLTNPQKVERGRQAMQALDNFLSPAFDAVIAAYTDRLEDIASKTPWEAPKITALANAVRIAKEVRNQIAGLVYEGDQAKADMVRVEKIEALTPAKRRLLNIGPF